VKEINPECCEV